MPISGPFAEDDDIVWNTDQFEMLPDRVNPETPDAMIAMIKVSGSPWLQEQIRNRLVNLKCFPTDSQHVALILCYQSY